MGYSKVGFILLSLVCLSTLLTTLPATFAVDDFYKPYLHDAKVPEHPKVELYGSYSTNLFPGSATYIYPIEVPQGTNGLQPSISINYNSQNMKQRPGILGAGWSLTQNYIYRDANSTLGNTADDEFNLILNGVHYDLVYDSSDSFYHTNIESYLKIQNLTGGLGGFFGAGGSIQVGGTFTPKAKTIKDLEGKSHYYGVEVAAGPYGGGGGVSYPSTKPPNVWQPSSYSLYYSPGAELTALYIEEETRTLTVLKFPGRGSQLEESSSADITSEQRTQQNKEIQSQITPRASRQDSREALAETIINIGRSVTNWFGGLFGW